MAAFGWSKTRLAVAAGAAVAITATGVGVAFAQTPTATPTRQQKAEEHLNRFARNLGVDPAKVKEAMQQTAVEHIDAEVAAGRLTAEQAQRMKDAIASGQLGAGFGGPGFHGHKGGPGGHGGPGGPRGEGMRRGPGGPGGMLGGAPAALGTFLGVTPEQLRTELQGKSLADVARAHGKSADELKAFLTSEAETRLAAAVTSGKLTQDQSTKMLEMMKANLDQMINAVHQMRPFGPGGPGGFRGPQGPVPPVAPATPGTSS